MVNYSHEVKKFGQSESILYELIGFDKEGKQILSNESPTRKSQYQSQLFQQVNSYLYLIDLYGDNKYSILIINKQADEGISRITVECFMIQQLDKIQFIMGLTKCDQLQNKEDNCQSRLNNICWVGYITFLANLFTFYYYQQLDKLLTFQTLKSQLTLKSIFLMLSPSGLFEIQQ